MELGLFGDGKAAEHIGVGFVEIFIIMLCEAGRAFSEIPSYSVLLGPDWSTSCHPNWDI